MLLKEKDIKIMIREYRAKHKEELNRKQLIRKRNREMNKGGDAQ